MQTGRTIHQTYLRLLLVKMARFLSVASLLFFSYIVLVAAESIPRMQANDVVVRLARRTPGCDVPHGESYDIQLH